MRRSLTMVLTALLLSVATLTQAQSDAPPPPSDPVLEVIRMAVVKAIKAFDLMIQRLQTKTIWLQNAAKALENKLSELKLKEIAEWTDKQRELYRKYYDELWNVRSAIATYHRVMQVINRQKQIVEQYRFTWRMISQDEHFTASEIDYMYRVYGGILNESVQNIDQVLLVINAYRMQMSDAKRLEAIGNVAEAVEKNYADLNHFNQQNIQLSLNRAKDEHEVESIKKLYGLH